MNNKKKKIIALTILILSIIFILSCIAGPSLAADTPEEQVNVVGKILDGVASVLLLPAKYGIVLIGLIISWLLGRFKGGITGTLTIEDILFNKLQLTDINLFNLNIDASSVSYQIRSNVAIWYTSIRNLAAIILAIIAIYVGIRMALSTIAEDKAKYKSMLIDWITSLALLFVLQYIMIFVIYINNTLVNLLSKGFTDNTGTYSDITNTLFDNAITHPLSFVSGFGSAIAYLILEVVTFIFFLTYVKRMITLAFLTIISPLVTVTYSLDKMGDGKSQALNIWLKEFIYNILIQPFHCVAYLALGSSAVSLLSTANSSSISSPTNGLFDLGSAFVGIFLLIFIFKSEDIIKHIFHFESQSMGSTVAQAALTTAMLSKIGGAGKKAIGGSASKASIAENTRNTNNLADAKGQPRTRNVANTSQENFNNGNQRRANNQRENGNIQNNNGEVSPTEETLTANESTNQTDNGKNQNGFTKFAKKWGGRYLALNARALGLGAGFAFGASTGDIKASIGGAAGGFSVGSSISQTSSTNMKQHELAKSYNNYRLAHADLTNEQLIQNSMDLLDPTKTDVSTLSDGDKAYRESLLAMQSRYSKNGMSGDETEKKMKKTVKAIQSGDIGEHTGVVRFTSDAKDGIKNKADDIKKWKAERKAKNRTNEENV